MENVLFYGLIGIALIILIGTACIMLAYPFIVIKQKRFTKTDLIISIIMYGIVTMVIMSILFENEKISPAIYFSLFGLFLLFIFISIFVDLIIYKKRNKHVIGNGLFLSDNDLYVITNGIIPSNKRIEVNENIKKKCNDYLSNNNLGSLDNPALLLKNKIEPIKNSNYMISNSPNIQGTQRMIFLEDLTKSTLAVDDNKKWYLEDITLSDININKLYDYVKWCIKFTPDDFSVTLSYDEGMKLYKALIINSENDFPFPKFTEQDIVLAKNSGISDNFLEALKTLESSFKYFYSSVLSKNMATDLSSYDGPISANITYRTLIANTLSKDKELGSTYCVYTVLDTKEKNNMKPIRRVEIFPKHGIGVVTDMKDDNKTITFKSVKNNQELLNELLKDL